MMEATARTVTAYGLMLGGKFSHSTSATEAQANPAPATVIATMKDETMSHSKIVRMGRTIDRIRPLLNNPDLCSMMVLPHSWMDAKKDDGL